jgi:hypothetical protein
MTREEVMEKFRVLASRVLSPSRIEQLHDTIEHLERFDDAGKVALLLVPNGNRSLRQRIPRTAPPKV